MTSAAVLVARLLPGAPALISLEDGLQAISGNKAFPPQAVFGHGALSQR